MLWTGSPFASTVVVEMTLTDAHPRTVRTDGR
jgi:hypothetical protein